MSVDGSKARQERTPRDLAQRVPDAPEVASTLSVAARAAGNHAIARLLARQPPARTNRFMAAPHATQVLQRFLLDPEDSRVVWMGSAQEYWRQHGDRLMALLDKRGFAPP